MKVIRANTAAIRTENGELIIQVDEAANPNLPPVVTNPGNQAWLEGDIVFLPIIANDPDEDNVTYKFFGLPDGLVGDTVTGLISGSPAAGTADGSPYLIAVEVSDTPGNKTTIQFSINVLAPDAFWFYINAGGPAYTDTEDAFWQADGLFRINSGISLTSGTVTEIENAADDTIFHTERYGDDFSYVFENIPNGNYLVRVFFVERNFTGPNLRKFDVSVQGTLWLNQLDIFRESQVLSNGLQGMFYGLSKERLTVVSAGTLEVRFHNATAGRAQLCGIQIIEEGQLVNDPPIINVPADQSSIEGEQIDFFIYGSDPEGDAIAFSAANLPAGVSISTINATTARVTGTITAGAGASSPYASSISVNDGVNAIQTKAFTWTVAGVEVENLPPVLLNPGNKSYIENDFINLQIVASDPEGDQRTFSLPGAPSWLNINSFTGLITGRPPVDSSLSSPYSIQVQCSDGNNPPVSVTFQLAVTRNTFDPLLLRSVDPNDGAPQHDLGPYIRADYRLDFPGAQGGVGFDTAHADVVDVRGIRWFRFKNEANKIGQQNSGIINNWQTNAEYRVISYELDFFFPPDFDPVLGGKMWLSVGHINNPSLLRPNGTTEPGSCTTMWHNLGDKSFVAHPNQVRDDFQDNYPFTDPDTGNDPYYVPKNGTPMRVRVVCDIGTPGGLNGSVKTYLDIGMTGYFEQIGDFSGFEFLRAAATIAGWNEISWLFFFGGGTSDWAPNLEQFIFYRNIKIYGGNPWNFNYTYVNSSLSQLNNLNPAPGTVVVLNGTSSSQAVDIDWQGTSLQPIVILGKGSVMSNTFNLKGARYVVVIDVDSVNSAGNGIVIQESQYIWLRRCKAIDPTDNGIRILGSQNPTNRASNICLIECEAAGAAGSKDNITFHAQSSLYDIGENFFIYNCISRDVDGEQAFDVTSGKNFLFLNNRAINSPGNAFNIGHGAQGIVVHTFDNDTPGADKNFIIKNAYDITLINVTGDGELEISVQNPAGVRATEQRNPVTGLYNCDRVKLYNSFTAPGSIDNNVGAVIEVLADDPLNFRP